MRCSCSRCAAAQTATACHDRAPWKGHGVDVSRMASLETFSVSKKLWGSRSERPAAARAEREQVRFARGASTGPFPATLA